MFPLLSLVPALFVVIGWVLVGARPMGLEQPDPGQAAYDRVCKVCHGPEGSGSAGPALVPFEMEPEELIAKVRAGGGEMPAFSPNKLSDEEITKIAAYLKSLKSPVMPPFARMMQAHQPDLRHN